MAVMYSQKKDTANLISFPCKESDKCKLQGRQKAGTLHKLVECMFTNIKGISENQTHQIIFFPTEFLFSSMSYAMHLSK